MSPLVKPLGHKSYPSISHLISSKLGKGDHHVSKGQDFLATGVSELHRQPVNDPKILVIVQEKVDGSCVSVARINDKIIALGRAGYPATSSEYEHIQLFAVWVRKNEDRFRAVLNEGERMVGEWLAMASGLVYILKTEPFIAFDLMRNGYDRATNLELSQRVWNIKDGFTKPFHVWTGEGLSPVVGMMRLGEFGGHGATEQPEGLIYRVEKNEKTLFLAKYVRPDFKPGRYLPRVSGQPPIWQYKP